MLIKKIASFLLIYFVFLKKQGDVDSMMGNNSLFFLSYGYIYISYQTDHYGPPNNGCEMGTYLF
jgi:hypothetical protein